MGQVLQWVALIAFGSLFVFALLANFGWLPDRVMLWCCHHLGWHSADPENFDGCSCSSHCHHCGKRVLMDSQGNWF